MNLVKKILVSHPDAAARRRIRMLLTGAGFDVRTFSTPDTCLEGLRNEWFDLALLNERYGETVATEDIRKVQPTLPIFLIVDNLEFPVVVQGIRHGVSDVLTMEDKGLNLVSRICTFFNVVPGPDADLSSEELAQVEELLSSLGTGTQPLPAAQGSDGMLFQFAKDKSLLERQLERVANERNALEAQLRALLAQNGDSNRLAAQLAELRTQREIVTAAQAAIDEKAQMLNSLREEIRRERGELERTRRDVAGSTATGNPALAVEWAEIGAWRKRLAEQSERVQAEATRLQQDRAQLASERRDWHRDLDELREQEENLRHYETKLRELQAQLETERVSLLSAQTKNTAPPPAAPSSAEDESLAEAWSKLKRATELFEAERSHLREDRLAIRETEKTQKLREITLSAREEKLRLREEQLRVLDAAQVKTPGTPSAQPEERSTADKVKAFTRAPFAVAKAVFTNRS